MDKQEFQITDGTVNGQVTGTPETKHITIEFDIKGANEVTPTLDMEKYKNAVEHLTTLREVLQQTSQGASITQPQMRKDGVIELSATFAQQAEYDTAIELLQQVQLQSSHTIEQATDAAPTLLEKLGEEYRGHPEDMPTILPQRREEDLISRSFTQHVRKAESVAEGRGTLKTWHLDGEAGGISAAVFPLDKSLLTDKEADEGVKLIAVRIAPGSDTENARDETFRHTREVEKLLLTRGLSVRTGEVYMGAEKQGHLDTGIIVLNAGESPLTTLEKVNATLEHLQDQYAVFSLKLGSRNRGLDNRPGRSDSKITTISAIRQEHDPLEDTIEAHLHAAENSGLLAVRGEESDISAWVKSLAADMRTQIELEQQQLRRGAGGRS